MIGDSRFKDAYFQLLYDLFHFLVKPGKATKLIFSQPGFLLDEALAEADTIVEIGGPTGVGDYEVCNLLDYRKRGKRVIVTNIVRYPENPNKDYDVELIADGRNLPFPNQSLEAVFASCVPHINEILPEIARVLEPGGIFVWRGNRGTDVYTAEHSGLEPMMYLWHANEKEQRELTHRYPEQGLQATIRDAEYRMHEIRKASLGRIGNFLLTRANTVFSNENGSIEISPPLGDPPYVVVFRKK